MTWLTRPEAGAPLLAWAARRRAVAVGDGFVLPSFPVDIGSSRPGGGWPTLSLNARWLRRDPPDINCYSSPSTAMSSHSGLLRLGLRGSYLLYLPEKDCDSGEWIPPAGAVSSVSRKRLLRPALSRSDRLLPSAEAAHARRDCV